MAERGFWVMAEKDPGALGIARPDGADITRGELLASCNQLVHGLQGLGLGPGDCVATLLPNGAPMIELYLAIAQAGMYLVPINWHLTGPEAAYILEDCDAKVFFSDERFTDTAKKAADEAGLKPEQCFAIGSIDGFESYDGLKAGQPTSLPEKRASGLVMNYTSGTTGRPKGVRRKLSPLDPDTSGTLTSVFLMMFGMTQEDGNVHICGSPLYHTAVLMFASSGGQFRQQVKELRAKIDSTCPHYIRCIKPNAMLVPDCFDCEMVLNQLRCGGILQAVSVTRDGFTLHYTHVEFLNRYKGLLHGSEGFTTGSPSTMTAVQKKACILVDRLLNRIEDFKMSKYGKDTQRNTGGDESRDALIQLGKSKVLLKHHAFEALEAMLGAQRNKYATRLNAVIRRYLCRSAFLSARECFREELRQKGQTFDEWFKEYRELYYQPRSKKTTGASVHIPNIVKARMEMFKKACSASSPMSNPSSTTKKAVL